MIDQNGNQIPDTWERKYFGEANPNPDVGTDFDGDRFTELTEFIAGTDPTNSFSCLELSAPIMQPNHTLQFNWRASPGRAYWLQSSSNLLDWTPVSEWMMTTQTNATLTLPPLQDRENAFRLEVRP